MPKGHFIVCNDSVMTTVQLRVGCFTDRQGLRALSVALGYKSRAFWLYQDHPLDYPFVMLTITVIITAIITAITVITVSNYWCGRQRRLNCLTTLTVHLQ